MVQLFRKFGLATTALTSSALAIAAATPAQAGGPITPVQGDISPLYGKINPFYGDVNAAYGKINPFYGKINPFYGKINPFWGGLDGFWGTVTPFAPTSDPATTAFYKFSGYDPFWGKNNPYSNGAFDYTSIGTFWTSEFAAWTPILAQWNAATTSTDAADVAKAIQNNLLAPTASFWAPIMAKSGQVGNSTQALILSQLTAAGIKINADGTIDGQSLLGVDPSRRAMLFLNIYDNLMDYAGTGHVDWWMGAVGWSPMLAQTEGTKPAGLLSPLLQPTIGMVDFVIADGHHVPRQVTQYGSSVFSDGHGAAVGSLIIGATDGSGVMGVMPQGSASVIVYDPYDDTGTTNWTDVGKGVATLSNTIFKGKLVPMGVLNASLGVPGWTLNPGWNDALKLALAGGHDLVIAAGNDGTTQTQNVPWNFLLNPTTLIVGSVGADGTISNFSNRPGEACLLPTGTLVCSEANKLNYRFIVAPGELILVSDGMGGHMRQSGTSLAAPLVSGAIALLQNRWPWLSLFPEETAQIILKSATPKGEHPGADPVYGVGELNIAASQAPLDWNKLVYYQHSRGRLTLFPTPVSQVMAQVRSGTQSSWDASGLWFSAFENIGLTFRDFQIPLSSKLVGQNVATTAGGQAYQSYLAMALRSQASHFAGVGAERPMQDSLVSGFARSTVPAGQFGGMQLRVSVTPAAIGNAFQMRSARYDTDAMLVSDKASFSFGYGNGAAALDGSAGFAFRSDYDLGRGGANPLIGLASGGAYLGGRAIVADGLTIGFGTTDRMSRRNLTAFGIDRGYAGDWVNRYSAQAQTMSLAYRIGHTITARASFTHLHEDAALLGIQSLDRDDLQGGSTTDGMSAGFDLAIGKSWTLAGTSTISRTRADAGQIRTNNLTSASAELAVIKSRLLAKNDELRLTLASPLHTIGGHLTYSSVGVIDRSTGEIGIVDQAFAPKSGLPIAGQAMYGLALPKGKGEFSFFGRVDRDAELIATNTVGYSGGVQLHLAF
jgi:hypothetical protein